MAEAWAIVGVAVNIATIIDLGFKLVSSGIAAHESIHGTTREIETLNILLDEIENTNDLLQATKSFTDGLSCGEPRFRSLAKECDKLVKELRHILAKLRIREEALSRTIESGRVAIQSWWKRKDIAAMKDRLLEVEARLKDAVARILSQTQHSSVMDELRALRAEGQMHQRQSEEVKSQMDSIRHDIDALSTIRSGTAMETGFNHEQLHYIHRDIEIIASSVGSSDKIDPTTPTVPESLSAVVVENQSTGNKAGYAAQLYQIREDILQIATRDASMDPNVSCSNSLKLKLNAFTREHDSCVTRLKVLKSLYFPELKRRFADITDAEANTLGWLHDPSKTSFTQWLASQHGIYWINGLAGSGKSTLMKSAAGHAWTKPPLMKWAGNLPLHVAAHYFWHHGHSIQRSQVGLFRSLLYQILRASPGLIPLCCPDSDILEFEEWEMADLKAIFDRLCQQTSLSAKFCFFIDGLDEYNGEERELIETLRLMTSSPHIKICVSSRPWPEFAKEVGWNTPTLVVQDYTLNDMKTYVQRRLLNDPDFQKLRDEDHSCDDFIPEIAERAQGVWLWTFLVTHDLKRAVTRKEPLQTLRMILESFPRRLEDYFEHIVSRVDTHYRKDMVRIFMMVVEAAQPLPLFVFRFLQSQDQDPNYAINALSENLGPFGDVTTEDWARAVETARARLNSHGDMAAQDKLLEKGMTQEEHDQLIKFAMVMEIWKVRIHNRCSDLLRVTEDPDGELLVKYRVSFLHRTVADWLRENYATEMKQILSKAHSSFNTKRTLCYMMLMLLKELPTPARAETPHIHRRRINLVINLTDELLCYVYQLEQTDGRLAEEDLVDLLDDLDDTNSSHFDYTKRNHSNYASKHWKLEKADTQLPVDELGDLLDDLEGLNDTDGTHFDRANSSQFNYTSNHWTNVRDWPRVGSDRYIEGGQCNFMALAVQCRLLRYVRSELKATATTSRMGTGSSRAPRTIGGQLSPHDRHPSRGLYKKGRPLLDYALRPRRVTPLDLPYYLQTEAPSVDPEMVRLLVDEGAEVNARVHLNDGTALFPLFLVSCYEACRMYDRPRNELVQAWYRSACILVENGARLDGTSGRLDGPGGGRVMTTEDLLVLVFGRKMTADLKELSLVSAASRPGWGLWALHGRALLWDILQWISWVFWKLLTPASISR
ncbi:hypothetical protein Daus18300_013294 [Diaporthe australafricana]|uniref:NACHT domain-containing protein n=1 Tax=Diaporthe australafricana TaxID=127596 RepID=A0ABR3VZK3_9PEZI